MYGSGIIQITVHPRVTGLYKIIGQYFLIIHTKDSCISFNSCSVFLFLLFLVAGCRNISNALSIGTKIDRSSADLKEVAQKHGFWDGQVSATMFFQDSFCI